jgi:hypothetical protein
VSAVGRPVHGVDLGQVTLECSLGLHELVSGDRLVSLLCDGANCSRGNLQVSTIGGRESRNESTRRQRGTGVL